eukprot:Sspe_Gene.37730::Locus_18210_Transcript_1_1_Confidence_1.000_Length_1475::g.37730::m.37730
MAGLLESVSRSLDDPSEQALLSSFATVSMVLRSLPYPFADAVCEATQRRGACLAQSPADAMARSEWGQLSEGMAMVFAAHLGELIDTDQAGLAGLLVSKAHLVRSPGTIDDSLALEALSHVTDAVQYLTQLQAAGASVGMFRFSAIPIVLATATLSKAWCGGKQTHGVSVGRVASSTIIGLRNPVEASLILAKAVQDIRHAVEGGKGRDEALLHVSTAELAIAHLSLTGGSDKSDKFSTHDTASIATDV